MRCDAGKEYSKLAVAQLAIIDVGVAAFGEAVIWGVVSCRSISFNGSRGPVSLFEMKYRVSVSWYAYECNRYPRRAGDVHRIPLWV